LSPKRRGQLALRGIATKSSTTLTGLAAGNVRVRLAAKGTDDQSGRCSDAAQEVVR
jgi:hypothetical protein